MSKKEAVYILVALASIGTVYFLATSVAYEWGDGDEDCGCEHG
jgi:hypothetical protein